MLRRFLVVFSTLFALAGTLFAASPAMASPSRATVVSERMLSDRLVELVVRSPALGADVGVQLLLPKDWQRIRGRSGRRCICSTVAARSRSARSSGPLTAMWRSTPRTSTR